MYWIYKTDSPHGYERVYLPLYKVADTPLHIQGDVILVAISSGLDFSQLTLWIAVARHNQWKILVIYKLNGFPYEKNDIITILYPLVINIRNVGVWPKQWVILYKTKES